MQFALELAERLTSGSEFWDQYTSLQRLGAASTLPKSFESSVTMVSEQDLAKLLYCASIFTQTDKDEFKSIAQSTALNALLISTSDLIKERCLRILVSLGNFPGITYAESTYHLKSTSLIGLLNLRLSRELNSIDVGSERIALTDYQHNIWDNIANSRTIAISAPTSAGKSFLVIEHLCRLAENRGKFRAVYIAPTRALLSEVYLAITKRLSEHKAIRVSNIPTQSGIDQEKEIFVLTQERLQVLLSISSLTFDLVVLDEAQNLSDGARGMILQECLEEVIRRKADTQLIMIAPGASGFAESAAAMGIGKLESEPSMLSPVVQNRIVVTKGGKNQLNLGLLTKRGEMPIGVFSSNRGFELPETRIAEVALDLGSTGGSLVYATGPREAERIAILLAQDLKELDNPQLNELSGFISLHIHADYTLASLVRKGVAFHYGKMPSLLREALEAAFKNSDLHFLVCTTTLFQGVNLPARNVFIDSSHRGLHTPLDPALLWNFAGRAGRMKKDIVGNVFLVDYNSWDNKPMDSFVGFRIRPALRETLSELSQQIGEALEGKMPKPNSRDERVSRIRASAGLLIAHGLKGDVTEVVNRALQGEQKEAGHRLCQQALEAGISIGLPESILRSNWLIDPFGQKRLHGRIVEKIRAKELQNLIPVNPHEKGADKVYASIFSRIRRTIYEDKSQFGALVSGIAIKWMKGVPYPVILAQRLKSAQNKYDKLLAAYPAKKAINSRTRKPAMVDPDKVIFDAFELIEDLVRFQFVQLGKAYIDLLSFALETENKRELVPNIFDFSLALELGIATTSGRSFIELGLSRIAASALQISFPNTNLSVEEARKWLLGADLKKLKLNQVIIDEVERLGLRTSPFQVSNET